MPTCRLILERLNPLTRRGNRQALSILFPMEKIFEDYVAAMLPKQLQDWCVSARVRGKALVEEHLGRRMFSLIPDLELSRGARRIIADTKWKLLNQGERSNKYRISQSDIYQLFAYAKKYLYGQERREVYLIYPRTDFFREPLRPFWYQTEREVLYVLPYDLEKDYLATYPKCSIASEPHSVDEKTIPMSHLN
jgi:5-methylcytosine-specific restriction enzyme subunit McrC